MNKVTRAHVLAAVCLFLGNASTASAHGFGQRYDLPVPLWLYVSGAAVAVAFSFVVIGIFVRGSPGVRAYPRLNLLQFAVGRLLAHPLLLFTLKLLSAGLFVLVILTGLIGDQHPLRNLAPTLVWVIWWVGLAYVSALLGNLWALINPWKVLFGWAEGLYRRIDPDGELSLRFPYPEALGVWPGVVLFLAFTWVELVFPGPAVPANLAVLAFAYSVITWTGMFLFGRERWLKRGEAFSLAFGVLARFAPTEIRVVRPEVCRACGLGCRAPDGECIDCYECYGRAQAADREWNLRPYAVGLLRDELVPPSMMAFVLVMLSTVTFDGFMATPAWAHIESVLYALSPSLGGARLTAVQTVSLVSFPILFLGVYLTVSEVMRAAGGGRVATGELARTFAFTLVPIALAYHLSHYLSYLLIQGQLVIPLASDPFGFGWNLLGTSGYRIDIGVVGARFAWYTAVIAIVAGHIIAIFLAHLLAGRTLADRRLALRSQYPMSALMVGYTMISLWILAQPIVESRTPPPAPAGTTSPGILTATTEAPEAQPRARLLLRSEGIALFELTLPPGYEGEAHTAPSDEAAYVLDGELTVISRLGGREVYRQGEVAWALKGTVHKSRNLSSKETKILVILLTEEEEG